MRTHLAGRQLGRAGYPDMHVRAGDSTARRSRVPASSRSATISPCLPPPSNRTPSTTRAGFPLARVRERGTEGVRA